LVTDRGNYGIRPDGSKDFPNPAGFDQTKQFRSILNFGTIKCTHSWVKFRDIALYWTAKGRCFRFGMAGNGV
jgi:hypothetical protein